MADVPVTLVAGYLGAGKTTWLNQWIAAGVPAGALILVNDFGTINIDAELIAYRDDRVLRLTNGCICCSLSESLSAQLASITRWADRPTAVIIETSGVAEPARIADLVRVSRVFTLAETVCLVDGASLSARLADERVARLVAGQIAAADRLVVNRLEDCDETSRATTLATLDRLNPAVASQYEPAAPIHSSAEAHTTAARLVPKNGGPSPAWARCVIRYDAPVERAWLNAILTRYSDVVVRAKGVLPVADGPRVFQWSGGRARWTATHRAVAVGQLVAIGFAGERFDAFVAETTPA